MNLRKQKRKLTRVFAHEVFHGRSRSGWTQQAVADRVGVSLRWYQKIEKGEVLPSFFCGDRPDVDFWYHAGSFGEGGVWRCTSTYPLKNGCIPRI